VSSVKKAANHAIRRDYPPEAGVELRGKAGEQSIAPASTEGEDGNKVNTGKLLEKVLDRGNHDKLIYLLAKRISDKRLLKLIRAYLESGVMLGGLAGSTHLNFNEYPESCT